MEPHMIDRDWSQRFTTALENAINDTTTEFDSSQTLDGDDNYMLRERDDLDASRQISSNTHGSDSFSAQTPTSHLNIIGREISADRTRISCNSTHVREKKKESMTSCSTKQSRGSTFHRSTLSLSPRKKSKIHTFPDLSDFWNRNKTNSISQQNSREGCDDSTISTKTSAFTKHMIFDLLSEHKRNIKWNQAHILSSLPPRVNENNTNQTIDPSREMKLNSNSEKGSNDGAECEISYDKLVHENQLSPSKSTTISIILMDVQNYQYEILQLRLNWCKSSVGDILKIIDKAIDENITECFLPESKFEDQGRFDDSNCTSIDSMTDCRYAKESITADMGTQKSNNITTLDGYDSFSESLISKIELTSDQFQRLDAYHQCQGNSSPYHGNAMKGSSKLKEIWEVRYDGILQCRSLPDEKPIIMINCFGLMRYEVAPHEVFLAKPKGMSARET